MQRLDQGSLSARAYAALREGLIAGQFYPGQRFIMQELADKLGTSITPVREACLRLVSERGLEVRSGRFVQVPDLSLSRYLEIRTIRIALEGLAAALAAERAKPRDLERLRSIHQRFEKADHAGNAAVARQANREFHFTVYHLAGMEMLTAQIEGLWISMGPILNVFYTSMVNTYVGAEEHLSLIEALQAKDGAAARAALERDLLRGGESIIDHLSTPKEQA